MASFAASRVAAEDARANLLGGEQTRALAESRAKRGEKRIRTFARRPRRRARRRRVESSAVRVHRGGVRREFEPDADARVEPTARSRVVRHRVRRVVERGRETRAKKSDGV